MELEVGNDFENEEQFWHALEEIISRDFSSHDSIDDNLRSYLSLAAEYRGQYITTADDVNECAHKLQCSPLFEQHADYVRRQFIYSLLQEDEPERLHIVATFVLLDARDNEHGFQILNEEGGFSRLIELIAQPREHEEGLHRLLMEILYEMSRIQKINVENLSLVQDEFICRLFNIIENVSDDVNDPYHYSVIRVLLVLNEQFMVAVHGPSPSKESATPVTNKVVKVLSMHGSKYKAFGENIILLLNREDETSLQLLTLKILYLLFTTPLTYEYFYTNDLHVLVDILIRNLLDLPGDAASLRHTYLRVLYPLLEHTQLQQPPHYKRQELQRLFKVLGGRRIEGTEAAAYFGHFEDADETTKRLVKRCQCVTWLMEDVETPITVESPIDERSEPASPISPISPTKAPPPALPAPRKLKKRSSSKVSSLTIGGYLTPQLESARQSSLSMMEVAAQSEKPGVLTPSRNPELRHGLRAAIIHNKEKPPVPQARRSGVARMKILSRTETTKEVATTTVVDNTHHLEHQASDTTEAVPRKESLEGPFSDKAIEEETVKQPPPAPRSRRWRRRRGTTDGRSDGTPREPGKFAPTLPSVVTTKPAVTASPFSPTQERLFSPVLPEEPESVPQPHISISAALQEAKAEALHDIEEKLEKAHIDMPKSTEPQSEVNTSIAIPQLAPDLHPQHNQKPWERKPPGLPPPRRTVLTPPGQAPPRAIPGPKLELERSPFLGGEEDEDAPGQNDEEEWLGLDEKDDWEKSDFDEEHETDQEEKKEHELSGEGGAVGEHRAGLSYHNASTTERREEEL